MNDAEQAQKAIRNKLYIAESYKVADTKTQCQKCQKLEHLIKNCINQKYCQIYAERHYTR